MSTPAAPATTPSGIEALVCDDIARRQQMGIQKYGTTVAENPLPLRGWLQHAYEESLDESTYLRRAIAELDRPPTVKDVADLINRFNDQGGNLHDLIAGLNAIHDHVTRLIHEREDDRREWP